MTVVVLGAGGRLGRLLRPRWTGAARWLARADVDLSDATRMADALTGTTACICLAGVTPGAAGDMQDNVALARATLDAAQRVGAGRVFLFSTAAVYGGLAPPLTETGPVQPLSDYAKSKHEMERIAALHDHPNTVLRLGNVAGADAILGGWRPGFTLDQFPDGTTPRRSYVGPGALARVLGDLMQARDLPPVLNLAAPRAVAMGDLLDAAHLDWTPRPATAHTIANVTLDTACLLRFTAFAPSDSTATGVVTDWKQGLTI